FDAVERAVGRRPVLSRIGGSLPIVSALARRGIPTVLTGFAPADCHIHAPNERLPLEAVGAGIASAREILNAWASLLRGRAAGSSSTSQAWPNRRISSMIGRRASPLSVSSYSTRGGVSA